MVGMALLVEEYTSGCIKGLPPAFRLLQALMIDCVLAPFQSWVSTEGLTTERPRAEQACWMLESVSRYGSRIRVGLGHPWFCMAELQELRSL